MKATAINTAESILEPFWDPELCAIDKWTVNGNAETGTELAQGWCNVSFEWQNSKDQELVLAISKRYEPPVDVSRYDMLLLSAMVSNGCAIRIEAETDRGLLSIRSAPFGQEKQEIALPVEESAQLYSLRIEVYAAECRTGMGWLNWVGLQNSQRLLDHLAQFQYDPAWEGSLYPVETPVSFAPCYGIFISEEQLEKIRTLYEEKKMKGVPSPYAPNTSYDKYFAPETCIHDFVNFWQDTRYCRVRDNQHYLIQNGLRAAMYGILEKDAASLHLAARYAMSILACTHWDDGMICDFPVGSWEHRCFVQSLCLYDLVFIYDLAHEFFMPSAKSRLFRRLAEEGLASINYNAWRHEYIFENNQLIWFSHGRMAAYALLLKEWPRVAPYMEIAYGDIVENIQKTVLPDGGYVEGPTYFTCVGANGGQALYLYARAVGKRLEEVTPENLQASVDFADALLSTDDDQDMIPICDAHSTLSQTHLAFMAYLLKDSPWVNIFGKSVARSGGLADDYFALMVQSMELKSRAEVRPFVLMREMNLASSHRFWKGKAVKMVVLGNRSGAGHAHEDKGSFILEYAGQTFAMDPGTCDYSSSYSMIYKQCQRHNVLVPAGTKARVAAENPCMETISLHGSGDEQRFQVFLNAGMAYRQYYERWTRTIQSRQPNEFVILDEYELREECGCDRVEFLWNTMLPVERREDCVVICGKNGKAVVHIPENCRCEFRKLEMFQEKFLNQIVFIRQGNSSIIRTVIELI